MTTPTATPTARRSDGGDVGLAVGDDGHRRSWPRSATSHRQYPERPRPLRARSENARTPELLTYDGGVSSSDVASNSDYLHSLKAAGEWGSRPRGDFTLEELREWAAAFSAETGRDEPNG